MPLITPNSVPNPRGMLGWDGTNFYLIRTDATGHLQVDVVTSALPTGAATAANQTTMITALQLIDDLRNALKSVDTDALHVEGENQLFSLQGEWFQYQSNTNAAAGTNDLDLNVVPAGVYSIVLGAFAFNRTTAITRSQIAVDGASDFRTIEILLNPAIYEGIRLTRPVILDVGQYLSARFVGCALNDDIFFHAWGFYMTKA